MIGPDILVWTSTFFIKEPHSPTFAAWHQDGTYFGLEPQEQVCAWVALTDATAEAGCMEMLSSRGAPRQLHHAALGLAHSINRAGQTIMEAFDDTNPVAMALPAGSFSLHHELAVHRSAPNRAAHRRVGIGLNYIPTHVRVNSPVRLMAMLVRGEDTLRPLRPDRPAGRRTRRRGARRPSGGQRPLPRQLQHPGQAPRGAVPDCRLTQRYDAAPRNRSPPCAHPAAPPTPCARSR